MHFMAFAQQNGSLKSGDALKQKKTGGPCHRF
ncbi:hypothetical protein PANA5342_3265 [Pantoea ananatis LMG 5342]|jgi:hypothetical protein|nr:hypothetical protein PANA5342_3265 [Pantoea ananatis LMG 5342]